MSLSNNKQRMLSARGKLTEPNASGGCSNPIVRLEPLRYKLVLDSRYVACDSVSRWLEVVGEISQEKDHVWSVSGPKESPWFDTQLGYRIKELKLSLLGPPTAKAMVRNFIRAMASFAASGWKCASEEKMQHRLEICRRCSYWEEDARVGLGKCNHPGCGCSMKIKLWIDSVECPQKFW
jgi:hypothetical protein